MTIGVIEKRSLHFGGVFIERTGAFEPWAAKIGVSFGFGTEFCEEIFSSARFGMWTGYRNPAFTSLRACQNKNDTNFEHVYQLLVTFLLVRVVKVS